MWLPPTQGPCNQDDCETFLLYPLNLYPFSSNMVTFCLLYNSWTGILQKLEYHCSSSGIPFWISQDVGWDNGFSNSSVIYSSQNYPSHYYHGSPSISAHHLSDLVRPPCWTLHFESMISNILVIELIAFI